MRRMSDVTSIGGAGAAFPPTRWSRLVQARDASSLDALNELCRLYWKPAYAFVRALRPCTNEEAKDLTQAFFVELLEGGLLERYAPRRGSFRSYLRGALRLFLLEEHREATAAKRGGGRAIVPIDDAEVMERAVEEPDAAFDREWSRALLRAAVQDVEKELAATGRAAYFRVFDRHELNPPATGAPSHADLARDFGLKETDVNHYLAACRRMLRERVAERIRETVSDPEEVPEELYKLFS
jgi:RNA polymerase sigma-70 factor (ECF subfamily)